jgi:hypothetical protein
MLKETKHRSTIAPFECQHCGLIWYGWTANHRQAPNTTLCSWCYGKLDTHLWKKYPDFFPPSREDNTEEARQAIRDDAAAWIADKNNEPLPRSEARRFHRSVPKWMRSAIASGMVKTNSEVAYVVYSRDQQAVRAEIVDRSELKPFKIGG